MTDDDPTLLRRYAETGSEEAFTALVHRHLDLVYSAALRRLNGDAHRASDVAQSVFLSLARHAASLARRPVLIGWLYTTTRHAAIDVIRAEQRRHTREQHASAMEHADMVTTSLPEWEQLRPIIDEAVDQLSEREREIVLLRFFENRPFAEVGAKFSLSEDAARMKATRALEKLRTFLARRRVTSTAAALSTVLASQTISAAPTGLAASVVGGALTGVASLSALSFTVMTATTKTLLATAALVTVVALGTAGYEVRVARNTAHDFVAAKQDHDALLIENAALTSRLAISTAEVTRLTAQQKETGASAIKASARKSLETPSLNNPWMIPGYGRATVDRDRATLGTRYGQLYRALQLNPEQIAAFENAMVERQQSIADILTEATAQGLSISDTSVVRLTQEPYAVFQNSLRTLLGDAGYAQYQQYEKGTKTRELVSSIAGSMYSTDTPLSAAQGSALSDLIKTNTETKKTPMKEEGKNTIYTLREETDWAAVTAQAQGLLSVTQLSTLKQLAEKQRAETEMMRLQQSPKK